jgi:hypothetical protein
LTPRAGHGGFLGAEGTAREASQGGRAPRLHRARAEEHGHERRGR